MARSSPGSSAWTTLGAALIYLGLFMSIVATIEYARSARRQLDGPTDPRASSLDRRISQAMLATLNLSLV